jgi:ABC-2 type transport system permease protein
VFGLLTREMTSLVEANPTMLEALGVERGSDLVTSLAVVVVTLAATAVAVQGLGRLGAEESADRLGALLATRTSRAGLWLLWWAVVTVAALVVLALGCLALGLTTWAATGDRETVAAALEVGLGYAVPVVFVAAVAAALRALVPAWAPVAWALVAWIALVGFLAETLRLPGWARDLSPLHLVGSLPREEPDPVATTALAVGAVVLVAASVQAFRRRDLRVG